MGRAFEFRKARKYKRWGNMARVFTNLGKEITIAPKQGGPEPENNPRLRVLMQTAKKENMPKDNVERAIKRAVSKDFTDYKEMNYEGYGPFGIAIFVETATDNTTRTVANVRSYFNKNGGFHIAKKVGMSLEHVELELIDYGVDEVDEDEDEVVLYGEFAQNSAIQKYLEENGYEITSSEFVRIPNDVKEVTPEQRESIEKLIEKLEEDEDVQNVFHNMKEDENGDEE